MRDYDKYKLRGAYHWNWYVDPNWAWYKECVDRCVEFCKGSTLDLGCGDGLVATKIAENGFKVLGIDNDETAIDLAKMYGRGSFVWVNLNEMVTPPKDYVVCLNVIEHLEDIEGLLFAVKQAKKGAIIITDKATGHLGKYHTHEYTKKELLDTFKEFKPKYFEINSTEFGKPITFIGVEIKK